ncbi:MAG: choice-of-anchor M domain-containing protein [Bifidobacteriaceae bacterium]|jgi:surface-anchored protein|nr:choice-of-anchor M domain-containing protein [Bifidobacteriaceae bacterium]
MHMTALRRPTRRVLPLIVTAALAASVAAPAGACFAAASDAVQRALPAAAASVAVTGSLADPAGEDPDVTVLSDGDVRFAYQVVDGELGLRIAQVTDGEATWHELTDTVIHVQNRDEVWPGYAYAEGSQSWVAWESLSPVGSLTYRTAPTAALAKTHVNTLALSWDASLIQADTTYNGVSRELLGVTTDSSGYFATHTSSTGSRQWDGRPNPPDYVSSYTTLSRWATTNNTSATGQLAATVAPTGFIFSEPGVYCVTVGAVTYLPKDWQGTIHSSDTLTFAVGDVNPAAASPCPQPEPEQPRLVANDYPSGGNAVLRQGDIRLAATLSDGQLGLHIADLSAAEARDFEADEVVFHVPQQDSSHPADTPFIVPINATRWLSVYPPDALYWRTDGRYPTAHGPFDNNPIRFALDSGLVTLGDLWPRAAEVGFRMGAVGGPGEVFTYATQRDDYQFHASSNPVWYSAAPRDDSTRNHLATATAGTGMTLAERRGTANNGSGGWRGMGWAFSAPGLYCVEVTADATLADESAAGATAALLTFVVGDELDPTTVATCSEAGDDGPGQGEPDPGVEGVHYITRGHTDIGLAWAEGGGIDLYASDQTTGEDYSLTDTVLIGNTTAYNRATVTTTGQTLIGDIGSEYWYFSYSGNAGYTVWPGFSSLEIGSGTITGSVSWTLHGVSGPGDVLLYEPNAVTVGYTNAVLFNSKWGFPQSRDETISHEHFNWAFTQPGVYCLNLEGRVRDVDGVVHTAQEQLTVAMGSDIKLAQTTPCAWDTETEAPTGTLPAITTTNGHSAILGGAAETLTLIPHLTGTGLDVALEARGAAPGAQARYLDPETVVLSSTNLTSIPDYGELWRFAAGERWHLGYLENPALAGDPTLTIGQVDGPGGVWLARARATGNPHTAFADVGTRDGDPTTTTLWPGWTNWVRTQFTTPGIYCVPLTWNATRTDGTTLDVTKTLTYVAGSIVPSNPDYVDRSTVRLCADGGTGTDPGGENPGGGQAGWSVPNGTQTHSGATILNLGHVDVASTLDDGALDTTIKDTTEGGPVVWREPEQTVLQVLPSARTEVPTNTDYGFLGTPGSPVWVLPETQDPGLLWPGWSTEHIPAAATEGGIEWGLTAVSGPGNLAVYQTGAFGQPAVLFNTADGITSADQFTIPQITHAHGAWAFTAEGVYCLAFERSTTLTGGTHVSDQFTTVFAVGQIDVTAIDPGDCFTNPGEGDPDPTDPGGSDPGGSDNSDASKPGGGNSGGGNSGGTNVGGVDLGGNKSTGGENPSDTGGAGGTGNTGDTANTLGLVDTPIAPLVVAGAPGVFVYKAKGPHSLTLAAVTSSSQAAQGVAWQVISGPATINESGVVTFTGAEGPVKVAASVPAVTSDPVTIQVVRHVTRIRTPITAAFLQSGRKLPLPVAVDDSTDPTARFAASLKFTSSNPKAATVTPKGVIKAKNLTKTAKTTITVKAANGQTLKVKVTVTPKAKKLSRLTVTGVPGRTGLAVGKTAIVQVKATPTKATGVRPVFKSSNPKVLTIDAAGKITAKSPGTATITIKAAGKTITTKKITVKSGAKTAKPTKPTKPTKAPNSVTNSST